jgi:hypothetical protein
MYRKMQKGAGRKSLANGQTNISMHGT